MLKANILYEIIIIIAVLAYSFIITNFFVSLVRPFVELPFEIKRVNKKSVRN